MRRCQHTLEVPLLSQPHCSHCLVCKEGLRSDTHTLLLVFCTAWMKQLKNKGPKQEQSRIRKLNLNPMAYEGAWFSWTQTKGCAWYNLRVSALRNFRTYRNGKVKLNSSSTESWRQKYWDVKFTLWDPERRRTCRQQYRLLDACRKCQLFKIRGLKADGYTRLAFLTPGQVLSKKSHLRERWWV